MNFKVLYDLFVLRFVIENVKCVDTTRILTFSNRQFDILMGTHDVMSVQTQLS